MHNSSRLLAILLLALPLLAASADAPDRPLLMAGKQSLFQRVLATPGAELQAAPGAKAAGTPVTPFTALYVYARKGTGPDEWLQVGTDRHGGVQGWLPARQSLEWNQGLTVAFRDPAGQARSLLFRDAAALRSLAQSHDQQAYDRLYLQAESDTLEPDSPVVAIQPAGHVDINKDFYLVPIRRHEDIYLGSEQARLLQVSSVPLQEAPARTAAFAGAGAHDERIGRRGRAR